MAKINSQCPIPEPQTPSLADLTFSSSSEVKNFVRAKMSLPSSSNQSLSYYRFTIESTSLIDSQGNDFFKHGSLNYLAVKSLIFRNFFNPVDFDGRYLRELKDTYQTNEVGFLIFVCFLGCLGHSFMTYRRHTILEQKKRYMFQ